VAGLERAGLSSEPAYAGATWVSSYRVNPFDVSEAERIATLAQWSHDLLASDVVGHVMAFLSAVQENKFYADLAGTSTTQQRVRVFPLLAVDSADGGDGARTTLRTCGPPAGRGWEYLDGEGWDWASELAELPAHLAEKLRARPVEPGRYDLVIDPSNLWLTIHESVGHATELDRVLGYEASFGGTSFASQAAPGRLRYGSALMTITMDRTAPHGLATVGFDDEGVAAQSWQAVDQGLLTAFQLDRRTARLAGAGRSNGCSCAESAAFPPIQRMPNVNLAPAPNGPATADLIGSVANGIFIVGADSWSIDMQRRNFQLTGQRCYRISNGRLAGQLRGVAYQADTIEFWSALRAVAGAGSYRLFGADMCGKGQPLQTSAASHGCPSALFEGEL
jgi:TldD protein